MIRINNEIECCGCASCVNACPKDCISMEKNTEGFLYPSVDQALCIDCGLCERSCPFLDTEKRGEPIEAWAAKSVDEQLLFDSSSGGIFSLLASSVIEAGGSVFGAAFSEDFREVSHILADSGEELKKLRKSKYLQSRIGNTYRLAKASLETGKPVMFSGVPCQISGLKRYLRKEYDNLLCVDVICHGVPSPELWKKYLDDQTRKHGGTVTDVNFRCKKNGWEDFGINKRIAGAEVFCSKSNDPYMQMFLKNYSLRPSCYACKIKENGSGADITLGDFWGVENILPEMSDGKGTSLVIVHNAKGQKFFNSIEKQVKATKVQYTEAKKYNAAISRSWTMPQERTSFFSDMTSLSFLELSKKYGRPSKSIRSILSHTRLWKKCRRFLKLLKIR